ncbi:phytanoyl-CoA dioxygenase family protein [Aspergillus undulatus]|uniref:phytanoyl-CoA dioxygenase family protein n=1 Tax=Aspergillus undulatus TaxID=1810928 RepID=UPI003CCD4FCA
MPSENPPVPNDQIKRFAVTADPAAISKAFQEDAVVIIEGFLTPVQVAKLNADLDPLFARQRAAPPEKPLMASALSSILPPQQKRVHNLVGVSRVFRHEILNHPLMHDLCKRTFAPLGEYWVATSGAIENGPGTPEQVWHRDMSVHPVLRPIPDAPEMMMNFFTALTDFTVESGATQHIMGSHKLADVRPPDAEHPVALGIVKAGDSIVIGSGMVHRGGLNATSDFYRRSLALVFYPCHLTPYEASTHLPRRLVESMTPLAQRMIGWRSVHPEPDGKGLGLWTVNTNDLGTEMGLASDLPEDDEADVMALMESGYADWTWS